MDARNPETSDSGPRNAPAEATRGTTRDASHDTDVLVVGAGPTGLLLAGDLAEAGLRVTLLERRPGKISNLTRALVVHARTLEQLDARGLADELVAGGYPLSSLLLFGGATIDASRLHSRFPFVLVTPQFEVERLLERRARRAGVTFRPDSEVLGLDQDAGGVTVRFRTPEGLGSLRAAYTVGTDGVRSTIREAIGQPFPGKSVIRSLLLADVRLTREPSSPFNVGAGGEAFALLSSFGDGWYRVIGWSPEHQADDDVPVSLDEIRDITRRALGSDYGMHEARWISRFHSDERQAPQYRVGRVFLAGDAAHVHSPAGGQGMNTGLQDAANLSWKLAAVLRGHAPESLLDSYQAERHPVGKAVLRSSGALVRLALMQSFPGRVARATATRLLRRLGPLANRAILAISGLGIAYPAGPGAHRLAGERAPDIRLADGSRLYEVLRQGRFVLITPADEPGGARPADEPGDGRRTDDRATAGTHPTDNRPVTVHWRSARRTAVLVRPDGYIAWATDATAPAERARALRTAVRHWTGAESGDDGPISGALTPSGHAADMPTGH
ncbi:FAD-dependent monooxygenase [Streptomyces kronopolitis]|uniref:FAD-dependent monooxygenase n=1 Tax=Streptomyces kronopolitis TaxID=1612435 RepID=UPI003D98CEB3